MKKRSTDIRGNMMELHAYIKKPGLWKGLGPINKSKIHSGGCLVSI